MDVNTLGALADIVNEAIAKAVGPLRDRIKELESKPGFDDADIRTQLKALREGWDDVTPYDDTDLRKQIESLRSEIPAAYDDSEIKGTLVDAEMRIGAAHSKSVEVVLERVTDLRSMIEGVAKSVPAAYDDAGLIDRVTKIINPVLEEVWALQERKGYDDTALRSEVAELKKAANDWGDMRDAFDKHAQQVERQMAERPAPLDGRDALHLEVLPAIDEQKSYTRGTYAKHAGGLWRSFEQTSGLRGWECVVEGVASMEVEMVDKTLSVRARMSSGAFAELVKDLPIQIYKGVFTGTAYHQGDTVTWAGSLWHCNVTATKAKPGDGSTDWTLAVKKGRDGKEVVTLPRAEPQPVRIGGE